MIRNRIQNEANDVWTALSILDKITNAKYISFEGESWALSLKSILIQLSSNEEILLFCLDLAVVICVVHYDWFIRISTGCTVRIGSETKRQSAWARETGGSGNYEET